MQPSGRRGGGGVKIHPTAVVSSEACIGDNVEVGPFAVVGDSVRLGSGVRVGPRVVLEGRTDIGDNCALHTGVVVGSQPQDRKYKGEASGVYIGPRTVLREYVTVNRACIENGSTRLGADCWVMAYVHVAHDCDIGDGVIIANATQVAGHCRIGDNAVLGGVTTIHQNVRIGRLAMTGASARVAHDVPPFLMADGHPARLRGLNRVGLERAGWSEARRRKLAEVYVQLFVRGPLAQVAKSLEKEANADVLELLRFLSGSHRGMTAHRRG